MTRAEVNELDVQKADDKEWYLLRHEPNVVIKTIDDIILPDAIRKNLLSVGNVPLKGQHLQIYTEAVKIIAEGLENGTLKIRL